MEMCIVRTLCVVCVLLLYVGFTHVTGYIINEEGQLVPFKIYKKQLHPRNCGGGFHKRQADEQDKTFELQMIKRESVSKQRPLNPQDSLDAVRASLNDAYNPDTSATRVLEAYFRALQSRQFHSVPDIEVKPPSEASSRRDMSDSDMNLEMDDINDLLALLQQTS